MTQTPTCVLTGSHLSYLQWDCGIVCSAVSESQRSQRERFLSSSRPLYHRDKKVHGPPRRVIIEKDPDWAGLKKAITPNPEPQSVWAALPLAELRYGRERSERTRMFFDISAGGEIWIEYVGTNNLGTHARQLDVEVSPFPRRDLFSISHIRCSVSCSPTRSLSQSSSLDNWKEVLMKAKCSWPLNATVCRRLLSCACSQIRLRNYSKVSLVWWARFSFKRKCLSPN